jgi:hypothetical protein
MQHGKPAAAFLGYQVLNVPTNEVSGMDACASYILSEYVKMRFIAY